MSTRAGGCTASVLESLGPAITAGDYPPGSVLRTDELAQRFDVSRSVMREAVRVLESMHLVESRRRVGVTVRPKDEWNVYDPQVIRWRLAGADRPHQLRSLTCCARPSSRSPRASPPRTPRPSSAPNSPSARSAWSPPPAASSWRGISSTTSPSTG